MHSFRQAVWENYFSVLRRGIVLFFVFEKVDYCPWVSINYERCLELPIQYPIFYEVFQRDNYVLHQMWWKGSLLNKDQDLEEA